MKDFFKVTPLEDVYKYIPNFIQTDSEDIPLTEAEGRIIAGDIHADVDLPDFARSIVDGYAVKAATTFGASEGNPGYLTLNGVVEMGILPDFTIDRGEAAHMPTGGMLPQGADGVVMIEHTEALDDTTIEIYKSVAPGQNVIEKGEDFKNGELILRHRQRIRPQETGLLAAFGHKMITVYKKPRVGIISTGDEIVSLDQIPGPGQIRDINTYTLSSLVQKAGGIPLAFGTVKDDYDALFEVCTQAFDQTDMVFLSGGSSVGTRDFTIEVFSALPDAKVLVHGIPISPGKPTILASIRQKPFWGLPGHVVSAMVVFSAVVKPFLDHLAGLSPQTPNNNSFRIPARLTRNLSSAQGRIDFIRVRLRREKEELWADPVLGKSGLINTMVKADGLIEVGMNTEGLDKGSEVSVILF
jgi:molybdopterin molybdotransferase